MHTDPDPNAYTPKIPELEDIPSLDGEEGEKQDYSFDELLNAVEDSANKEIIIEIPAEQLQVLNEGLQQRKAKRTHRAKKAGLDFAKYILKTNSYPSKDKDGKEKADIISVHIQLVARKGIEVFSIKEPDATF